ncbi:glycosyltransferase family 4 protein [Kushneria marisflavi]|uniref:Uncharacterized protein n=1 Tax=Kushneria marisflavi TaxID=157779 RepID=A0A240UTK2_9GAMM|nr:glycosyltransferase family 4 protein [Kushneria marisflavi]ART64466.1 hypothetical protein B9H00_16530 [Kushneria marisflavi]RKD86620.1 glycosyltransferase involved in cell wall biosynthesis [Kushneria marisflavi]
MHVAHYIGLKNLGGAELLFAGLSSAWAQHDLIQSVLLRSAPIHDEVSKRLPASLLAIDYKRWKGFKLPTRPALIRRMHVHRAMRPLPRPDIALSWSNLRHNPILAGGTKQQVPYIHYEHGVSWIHKVDEEGRRFLNAASGFICVSHAAKRVLQLKWGVDNQAVAIVPNPLRNTPNPILEQRLPLEGRPLKLAFAGRLTAIKGVTVALHTLALLRQQGINAELHIAGKGSQESVLKNLSESLGIAKACHFHGFVNDTRYFFGNMDIALCPSIRESFGMASLEASAAGCPVIASRVDGLPETIRENISGITLPCEHDPRTYYGSNIMSQLPELVYDPEMDQLRPPAVIAPQRLADTIGNLAASTQRLNDMRQHAISHAGQFNDFQQYGNHLLGQVRHIMSATDRRYSGHNTAMTS